MWAKEVFNFVLKFLVNDESFISQFGIIFQKLFQTGSLLITHVGFLFSVTLQVWSERHKDRE